MYGLEGSILTRSQNSSRGRGCQSNHWSKHWAPVTTIRSSGMPWISRASRSWIRFQTNTASGTTPSSCLLVRLSQLAMQAAFGMPSSCAIRT